ncbi:hypothetical protein D0T87_06890 [Bacteroides sp. 51]|nr:hypothetical protein [Bacteroides sp. 51]
MLEIVPFTSFYRVLLERAKYRQNDRNDILIIEWSGNRKFRAWGRKERKNGKRIVFAEIDKI